MAQATANRFDAIVIGAGPAGSAVAIELAHAGWSVALIERQGFPRRKVCGECIAASNLPLLQRLGIADAFEALAGPALRQVTLWHGQAAVTADLPAAGDDRFPWGRAIGRETLDSLLLDRARAAGAVVLQPWSVQSIVGAAGSWTCELRAVDTATLRQLRSSVVVDAHGSWEDLPSERPARRLARGAADLFAFKADFTGSSLPHAAISVLALDGGYGGMVVADAGRTTVACCIRRDRLSSLRVAAPGQRVGEVVESWLIGACPGVRQALHGAVRSEPWLGSGPLDPGVRVHAGDALFRVGNAAGEAHPILGEGMSMALQSAALLCGHLLGPGAVADVPDSARQADLQRRYVADWRRAFAPRLRLATVFAQLAMRPRGGAAVVRLAQAWPGLLTQGARWGGKVDTAPAPAITSRKETSCPPPSNA